MSLIKERKGRMKILLVGVLVAIVLAIAVLVVAQTQQELDGLEQELSDAGYGKQEKTMFAGGGR